MDFDFTEEQEAVAKVARELFEHRATPEHLTDLESGDVRFDESLWRELAAADLLGISLPENVGGSGQGFVELALLLAEVGWSVAPVPVYATLLLGADTIARFGDDAQRERYLPAVVDGSSLLTVGDLTGHGVAATSGMAMLLGALRGMAVAGLMPGPLMGWLNELLDTSPQPALGSALCCRYEPKTRVLHWSQAGHPAPLLFRDGAGRLLDAPDGVLLGATSGAQYAQAREQLAPGDLLVLHTDGLVPRRAAAADSTGTADSDGGGHRLLSMAPLFAAARNAQDCVRLVAEEFGTPDREDDACVLVARVG